MDTQGLQDAIVVAEDAFAALLATRRSNRDSMSPRDFRAYNESTRVEQLQVTGDADRANQALRDALNAERSAVAEQVISVGTLKEGNSPGGVSPDG